MPVKEIQIKSIKGKYQNTFIDTLSENNIDEIDKKENVQIHSLTLLFFNHKKLQDTTSNFLRRFIVGNVLHLVTIRNSLRISLRISRTMFHVIIWTYLWLMQCNIPVEFLSY